MSGWQKRVPKINYRLLLGAVGRTKMSSTLSLQQLVGVLKMHPKIDICINSHGVKVGGKGTDQTAWTRMGHQQLTATSLKRAIDKALEPGKPSVSSSDEESSDSVGAQASPLPKVPKNADEVRRRLEQWKKESYRKEAESMDMDSKYCRGSECNSYIARFCKQENLSRREAADLFKFIAFSKRQGYLPANATVADIQGFCKTWSSTK